MASNDIMADRQVRQRAGIMHVHHGRAQSIQESIKQAYNKVLNRRECCGYFVFIIIFFVYAVTSRGWNSDVYFMSKGVSDQIIGPNHGEVPIYVNNDEFEFQWGMATHKKAVWKYIRDILIPILLSDDNYNALDKTYALNDHLVLLGGIRVRQYRETL
eukprot:939973_1